MFGGQQAKRQCLDQTADIAYRRSAFESAAGGARGVQTGYRAAIRAQHFGVAADAHTAHGVGKSATRGRAVKRRLRNREWVKKFQLDLSSQEIFFSLVIQFHTLVCT